MRIMTAMRQQILACLMLVLLSVPGGSAAAQEASEGDAKAAFLFHFTTLIEWPKDAFKEFEDAHTEVRITVREDGARVIDVE